jgi:hypothetical protein
VVRRAEVVVDLPVDAEVVERVDVGTGVGVHEDHVTGVADPPVDLSAHAVEIVDGGAVRRVAHEDLVGRVPGRLEARHADEVVDAEVVHRRRVGA